MIERRGFLRACLAAGGLVYVPKLVDRFRWKPTPRLRTIKWDDANGSIWSSSIHAPPARVRSVWLHRNGQKVAEIDIPAHYERFSIGWGRAENGLYVMTVADAGREVRP